jgi:hypothetical protein
MNANGVHKCIKWTLVNVSTQKFKDMFAIPVEELERKEYLVLNGSKCFLSLLYPKYILNRICFLLLPPVVHIFKGLTTSLYIRV